MRDLTQQEFSEQVTWVMCAMAKGGFGVCDPERCVCGAEGKRVAADLYAAGFVMTDRGEGTRRIEPKLAI